MKNKHRPVVERIIDFSKRNFLLSYKKIVYKKKEIYSKDLEDIVANYKYKDKIVVLCSGPSAKKLVKDDTTLYITTNNSFKLVRDLDYLIYLNDPYYLRQNVYENIHQKKNQSFIFSFFDEKRHRAQYDFFKEYGYLIKSENKYIIDREYGGAISASNHEAFSDFLDRKNIDLQLWNSGIFILIFGYFLSITMDKPLEIYGLDLGVGGKIHFDKSTNVTNVITKGYVKVDVKKYLDIMYGDDQLAFSNYSNFFGNKTGFKEE